MGLKFHLADKIDSFFGMILACAMGTGFLTMFLIQITDTSFHRPAWEMDCFYAGFLWTLVADGWLMVMTVHGVVKGRQPLAPLIAVSQPLLPGVFRPLVALWWLLHMVFACVIAVAVSLSISHKEWPEIIVTILISGGASYLAFSYLLLVVTAISRNLDAVLWLWKFRTRWALGIFAATFGVEVVKWCRY
jgi:hypothetical protein